MKKLCERVARLIPPVWLGSGLAVSFVAIPVVFSPAIRAALPPESVGQVAQSILGRYFWVQLGLWIVGVLARLGAGGTRSRPQAVAWGILGVGAMIAVTWMHPKLRELHRIKYDAQQGTDVRAAAAADFRRWHGVSQVGNLALLLTLGGLVVTGGGRPDRRE